MDSVSENFEWIRKNIEKSLTDAKNLIDTAHDEVRASLDTIQSELAGITSDIAALEENQKEE